MEHSIIDNIIVNHTPYDIESYTGASLQSLLTNKLTKLSFKLTIFFGYNASKNSVSHTIEVTEKQYTTLAKAIVSKNKDLLNNNKKFNEIMLNCFEKSNAYNWANTATKIENLYKAFV